MIFPDRWPISRPDGIAVARMLLGLGWDFSYPVPNNMLLGTIIRDLGGVGKPRFYLRAGRFRGEPL